MEQVEDLLLNHTLHQVEVVPALQEVAFLVEVQGQDHQVPPREAADLVQVPVRVHQVLHGAGGNRSD